MYTPPLLPSRSIRKEILMAVRPSHASLCAATLMVALHGGSLTGQDDETLRKSYPERWLEKHNYALFNNIN